VFCRSISVLLLVSVLTGCWKEPSKFNWGNAPGAEQLERLMWQAIREKNWNEVEHHLAPTFMASGPDGKQYDRSSWLAYLKAAPVREFSLGELTVQPNGADMVVTYEVRLSGGESAQPDHALRIMSVWQQLKRGWVLITQSSTPVK
jgi:hypothetical protein